MKTCTRNENIIGVHCRKYKQSSDKEQTNRASDIPNFHCNLDSYLHTCVFLELLEIYGEVSLSLQV